ncbi:hypothetical protein SteCoe_12771 [Stentor coeruleus]|uniref:Uncharacterized protein n=1 Tax=Stentor coeruleus TaxID=5963 RepID=A0A1R2CA25_9CILI|nr:hypothetical protein SteCoe_12771 [Stentor coeruleus]
MKLIESNPSAKPYQITSGVWMVPCRVDEARKTYIPSIKPFKNGKKSTRNDSRQTWTMEEDEKLKEIILNRGARQWSAIAIEINTLIHNGVPFRRGKQCRERWLGHLSPTIEKTKWSKAEDNLIMNQQALLGNRWCVIAKLLPGRTENQVKNRWRRMEKINKRMQEQTIANLDITGLSKTIESYWKSGFWPPLPYDYQ